MNKKIIYCIATCLLVLFIYWSGHGTIFKTGNEYMFVAILLSSLIFYYYINLANQGADIYLRPIPGLKAFEEAVGRATEMGKPVLFIPGISDLDQVETVSGLIVLGHVAGMTAQYETELNVPVTSAIVMEAGRDACRESYLREGRPDLYDDDMVHYLTGEQFAYAAGVNGIMLRDKPAAVFYQGKFYAESLILAETGNSIGAIQVAGTGSPSQIPFFVTACDYTLIGEEFFAASAYLSKRPSLIGSIKGQDINKLLVMITSIIFVFLFGIKLSEYMNSIEWSNVKSNLNDRVESTKIYWNKLTLEERGLISRVQNSSSKWDDLNYVERAEVYLNNPGKSDVTVLDTLSKMVDIPLQKWRKYSLLDKIDIVNILYGKRNIKDMYIAMGKTKYSGFDEREKKLWKIAVHISRDENINSITFHADSMISVNNGVPKSGPSQIQQNEKNKDLDFLYANIGQYYFLQSSKSDREKKLAEWGYDHRFVIDVVKYLSLN